MFLHLISRDSARVLKSKFLWNLKNLRCVALLNESLLSLLIILIATTRTIKMSFLFAKNQRQHDFTWIFLAVVYITDWPFVSFVTTFFVRQNTVVTGCHAEMLHPISYMSSLKHSIPFPANHLPRSSFQSYAKCNTPLCCMPLV